MKAAPKFKVGDILEVVQLPNHATLDYRGFKFQVTEIGESHGRHLYFYNDNFGRASWTEDYVELAEVCKSPLWRALE